MRRIPAFGLFLILLIGVVACGGIRVRPPKAEPAKPLPAIDDSVFMAPFTLSLDELAAELETLIPKEDAAENEWKMVERGLGLKWHLSRTPFVVSQEAGDLVISGTLQARAKACVGLPNPFGKALCKEVGAVGYEDETGKELALRFRVPLKRAEDGSLSPVTYTIPEEGFALPKIGSLLNSKHIPLLGKLAEAPTWLDRKLAAFANPRVFAETVWNELDRPIPLYEGLLLDPRPIAIHAAPLTLADKKISTAFGFCARPRVISNPADFVKQPVPKVQIGAPKDAFHLALEAFIRYDYASDTISKALKGVHQIQNKALSITRVEISAIGNKALIKVMFKGLAKGAIYLQGRPVYDMEKDVLSIVEVDFTLESRNVLLNVADWMLHESLLRLIEKHAQFKAEKSLRLAREKASAAMKREVAPGLRLEGELSAIRPWGIAFNDLGFVVRVAAEGTAHLNVTPQTLLPDIR